MYSFRELLDQTPTSLFLQHGSALELVLNLNRVYLDVNCYILEPSCMCLLAFFKAVGHPLYFAFGFLDLRVSRAWISRWQANRRGCLCCGKNSWSWVLTETDLYTQNCIYYSSASISHESIFETCSLCVRLWYVLAKGESSLRNSMYFFFDWSSSSAMPICEGSKNLIYLPGHIMRLTRNPYTQTTHVYRMIKIFETSLLQENVRYCKILRPVVLSFCFQGRERGKTLQILPVSEETKMACQKSTLFFWVCHFSWHALLYSQVRNQDVTAFEPADTYVRGHFGFQNAWNIPAPRINPIGGSYFCLISRPPPVYFKGSVLRLYVRRQTATGRNHTLD